MLLKRLMFIIYSLLFCSHFAGAKTYYISAVGGDDSRSAAQAQNIATPWKTLAKLNSFFSSLLPGDAVLLKRGETFYGPVIINSSGAAGLPIVISSYGIGNKPIISSFVTLTNWVSVGRGIYKSHNDSLGAVVRLLLINRISREMGRFPNRTADNGGYFTIQSHIKNTSVTSKDLPGSPKWDGAEIVIRKNHWIIDKHLIKTHSGNTILYNTGSSSYDPSDNFGFFVQNSLETLDQPGEWYYNARSKDLYVFSGSPPSSSDQLQASSLDNLISNTAKGIYSDIVFDDLELNGANASSIDLSNGKRVTVSNCNIRWSGVNGVTANNITNLKIENSTISNSNNNAIYLTDNSVSASITNNKIDSTATFFGAESNGDGNGIGIYCRAKGAVIKNNTVFNTAYIGISFGGDLTIVNNNFVKNFCLAKDDGSGIYTWTGYPNIEYHGRQIVGNIVLNGVGAIAGTDLSPNDVAPAEGIYLDDNASGILIDNNSVANISHNGIQVHNARNLDITNNTVFNSSTQLLLTHDNTAESIVNVNMRNNILFSKLPSQVVLSIVSAKNDVANMGETDGNYYDRPLNDNEDINIQYINQTGTTIQQVMDLKAWQSSSNKDISTKKSPLILPGYQINTLLGNNKYTNGNFDNSVNGANYWSASNSGSGSWINGKLDGGTLKISNSGVTLVTIPVNAVEVNKKYVLNFSSISNKDTSIKVYLRQNGNSYTNLTPISYTTITTTRTENQVVFTPQQADNNSCIVLESASKNLDYYVDNIKFQEANVSLTDPDAYIIFEYNATNNIKTINLTDQYVDAKNISYSGSTSLKPFSSIILMKKYCIAPAKPIIY